jgi:hypothetical protein
MSNRYGYGYSEEDPLASRRVPGVAGQRADEAEQPEHPADVREIDLAEDGEDDERADADEQVERLRQAASEEADDEDEARPPLEFGTVARADEDADEDADSDDEDEDDEARAAGEAPPADAATVDIGAPPDDEAAAVLVVEEDVEVDVEDAREPIAAETGDAAGDGQAGMTLAQATPTASLEAAAGAPAGATPALRPGALLAVDAEAVRRQFIDIQAGFVDEPRQAVEQAGNLVEELHRKVMESLQAERGQLSDALDAEEASTEDLRQALRAYRAYVDRLLGLSL